MSETVRASAIRLIVSDVDGVWTSGKILYLGDGREIKDFHVRDGLAVKLAQKAGLSVAVITSRSSKALERRCRELGITELVQGASSKLSEMQRLVKRLEMDMSEVCYIGDDLPDLAPIEAAAISAAPSDAVAEVLETVTWRLQAAAGRGAFRELVEMLLRHRGQWDDIVKGFRSDTTDAPKV